jgi:hypothetical protein
MRRFSPLWIAEKASEAGGTKPPSLGGCLRGEDLGQMQTTRVCLRFWVQSKAVPSTALQGGLRPHRSGGRLGRTRTNLSHGRDERLRGSRVFSADQRTHDPPQAGRSRCRAWRFLRPAAHRGRLRCGISRGKRAGSTWKIWPKCSQHCRKSSMPPGGYADGNPMRLSKNGRPFLWKVSGFRLPPDPLQQLSLLRCSIFLSAHLFSAWRCVFP